MSKPMPRIMGTFLIIKVSAAVFHLSGEIMRNVPIIYFQIKRKTDFAIPLLEADRQRLFTRE